MQNQTIKIADTAKKTLGQQLLDTDKEHRASAPVEAGDLANEYGKDYMKELHSVIENHSNTKQKYYIQVLSKHLVGAPNRGQRLLFVARFTKPQMCDTEDVWSYDNRTSVLKLEWSLPHRYEMKNFMANPELYDAKMVSDIKNYLKLSKIDVKNL